MFLQLSLSDIDINLALDSNEIGITFDYSINLGYVLHWWFIGIEENVTYSGECNFAVKLDDIAGLITSLGMSTESLLGEYEGGWLTVTDFSTSPNLLDTMLDCTIEIHLLRILTDLLGAVTGVGDLIDIVKLFISDVDLIASPMISGYMTADLLTENSAISLDTSELTFNEGATQKTVEMTVLGGVSQTSIRLSNMQYHVEFATDWDIAFDFSDTMNYFVQDVSFSIGTFPSITISSDEHELAAQTSTGYDQRIAMTVSEPLPPTTPESTTTPGSTTLPSTQTPPTGGLPLPTDLLMLLLSIGIGVGVVAVIVVVMYKKRE
ncbi:MAG: hypothetical protein ACXACE_14550 [Candidatus Thorarchaeota archaeon]